MGAGRAPRCRLLCLRHRSAHTKSSEVSSDLSLYQAVESSNLSKSSEVRRDPSLHREQGRIAALIASLKQCPRDIGAVRKIHAMAVESSHLSNIFVANSLINMYWRSGSLVDARKVFDAMKNRSVVSWNTMIQGYAVNREARKALELLGSMESQGFSPTSTTLVAGLLALSGLAEKPAVTPIDGNLVNLELLERVVDLHSRAWKKDLIDDCLANSLIDTYAKCGSLVDARMVFDRMRSHDVISWTSIIVACVENGEAGFGLKLFAKMRTEPDARTFAAALKACSILLDLETGRKIHTQISKRGMMRDRFLCTSLVDFYGKCGSMADALEIFESMGSGRNLVTWSAVIAGFGRTGDTERVIQMFQRMREEGFHPDGVVFLSLLRACGHGGFVDKANEFFEAMVSQYEIAPSIEHYHCMVDILSRANFMEEAVTMAESMPFAASTVTWNTILGSCWKWKNVDVAKVAFGKSLRLDAAQGLAYVLMANVYKSVEMWDEHAKIIDMNSKLLDKESQLLRFSS